MPTCFQTMYTNQLWQGLGKFEWNLSSCWSVCFPPGVSHVSCEPDVVQLLDSASNQQVTRLKIMMSHQDQHQNIIFFRQIPITNQKHSHQNQHQSITFYLLHQITNSNMMKTLNNGKETTSTTIINNRPVTIKTFKLEPGMTLQNLSLPPGTIVEPPAKVWIIHNF